MIWNFDWCQLTCFILSKLTKSWQANFLYFFCYFCLKMQVFWKQNEKLLSKQSWITKSICFYPIISHWAYFLARNGPKILMFILAPFFHNSIKKLRNIHNWLKNVNKCSLCIKNHKIFNFQAKTTWKKSFQTILNISKK